jgi:tyrosine-protein kinase Etk/Wzc
MAYDDQLSGRSMLSPEWEAPQGPGYPHQRHRDEGVDLSQLWGMVRDNARLVFAIGAAVFVLVMASCLTSRMTFRSVARLYLGELEAKALASGANIDITSGNSSEAGSEIEVLRSRSMVKRAALASGLNVHIAPPGWKPPRFWRWLVSWRNPSLLDVAANQVTASESALADDIVVPRNYSVKFISPTEYVLRAVGMQAVRGRLGEPLKTSDLTLTLLAGRSGPKSGAQYDVVVEPLEVVIERALEQLEVTVPKSGTASEQVRVLTLSFSSYSRLISAAFLDQLMQGYLDVRHAWKTEDASAAERFVTEQLATMQQSLDRTQEKLANYRAENRVVVLATEAEAMVQQMSRFEEQRMEASLQASSLRAIKHALHDPKAPIEAHLLGDTNDVVLQQLAASLNNSREKLGDYDRQYIGAAPELRRQQASVNDQLGSIRNYVDGKLGRADQTVGSLNKIIDDLGGKLKTVPGAELRMAQIQRESEVYSKMYSYLLERQQQAAITKASTVSKNRILDSPTIPLREDSPKLALHLASGVFGLLLGAVLVVLRGLFSGVFRRENDVRVVLGPVQVFARIPTRLTRFRARNGDVWPASPLFDVMAPHSDIGYAEAFRALRTNLYRVLPGEHGKVVLVTSPSSGDGKTTCALSLAAMLAADNRRVLVIDADVRKPSHHALLNVPREPGLKELISQLRGHWKDSIHTICLSVGWFDSISAGVGANAELLSDGYFATFLVNARSHYDFIVIDSASFPSVSDPLVLAPMSDFVLSVLRLGSTSRRLAEEHVSAIFTGSRGYAVVVNSVEAAPATAGVAEMPANLSTAFRRLIR